MKVPGNGETAKRWRRPRHAALVAMIAIVAASFTTTAAAQNNASATILLTDHDFSWYGGGNYPNGANHCAVCHGVPVFTSGGSGSSAPQWFHTESTATYTSSWILSFDNSTWAAGALTNKCLDCHDGTVAIDAFDTGTITGAGTRFIIPSGHTLEAFLGTELAAHHPVDIAYTAGYTANLGTVTGTGATPLTIDLGNITMNDPATTDSRLGGTVDAILLDGGQITCNSCHEQHNDRAFENLGGDPEDDPVPTTVDGHSNDHDFLLLGRLCFKCHAFDQPRGGHHIPRRDDPLGLGRVGSDPALTSAMNCTYCHGNQLNGIGVRAYAPACDTCHNAWTASDLDSNSPTGYAQPPLGHHGGDRMNPYFDCAACHADPLTGVVTGNQFGTLFATSCYQCHDDLWVDATNTAPTLPAMLALTGTVNQAVAMDASATTNDEDEPLAFEWDFGDGTAPGMPSRDPTVSHTYDEAGTYTVTVAVTDGTHQPSTVSFSVVIDKAAVDSGPDAWTIDVNSGADVFVETFEDRSGSLIGTKDDGTLAFGIEFVGVIFWMDLWMDLSGDSYWGTGDTYFGNIDRDGGTMSGVKFGKDGNVSTFIGAKQ